MMVVDASLVVAALVDGGPDGTWADDVLAAGPLAAPHLLPVEVANVLRRSVHEGRISADSAAMAHMDLQDLPLTYFPYHPFAERVWELRDNLTAYDAWYVAVAEGLGVALGTLDLRLAKAPGVRCDIDTRPR